MYKLFKIVPFITGRKIYQFVKVGLAICVQALEVTLVLTKYY
jgi:hypothetical protein